MELEDRSLAKTSPFILHFDSGSPYAHDARAEKDASDQQSQYETYTLITKRKRKGNGCRNSNTFVVKKKELILGQITFSYSARELNLNWCRG